MEEILVLFLRLDTSLPQYGQNLLLVSISLPQFGQNTMISTPYD